ncbi:MULTISPECIES: HIT family protein [unclassified Nocardia]|uniref:HIT family protein n=1 Tax=unclassified Nocardia TaxID=2637762 RepID=UPI0033B94EF1
MTGDQVDTADDDWRRDRAGTAAAGTNPTALCRLTTGWAVIGDTQHLPGYCVLIYDGAADQLTDLPRPERIAFMADLVVLGEAVERACRAADPAFRRINYEVLGNTWTHLHGHVHARYEWEPADLRAGLVYLYGAERTAPEHALDARHDDLRAAITAALGEILAEG